MRTAVVGSLADVALDDVPVNGTVTRPSEGLLAADGGNASCYQRRTLSTFRVEYAQFDIEKDLASPWKGRRSLPHDKVQLLCFG